MLPSRLQIRPPIIAHRGARYFAPENTLSAFLKASELGFTWVELDVMLSADNELVVIHDEELARTTNGHGAVLDYSYDELKQLDAGSWFASCFAGERISTLSTVLTFLYEHQLSVNIEIKALQHRDEIIVQKIRDILHHIAVPFISPPLISSFSYTVLQQLRKQSADILLGFLMDEWLFDWEKYCDSLDCLTVNMNHDILTFDRVQMIKKTGRQLMAYTVNNQTRAQQLFSWGVDAIFSDCPPEIVKIIKQ